MPATRAGTAHGILSGTPTLVIPVPASVEPGDLVILSSVTGNAGRFWTDSVTKGWRVLAQQAFGSRTFQAVARIHQPGLNYELTLDQAYTTGYVVSVIRGHIVTDLQQIVVGDTWRRTSSTGLVQSQPLTVLSEGMALSLMGEATTATGGWAQTQGAFDLWDEQPENTGPNSIEWAMVFAQDMAAAGSTSLHVIEFAVASGNGFGVQVFVPSGTEAGPPEFNENDASSWIGNPSVHSFVDGDAFGRSQVSRFTNPAQGAQRGGMRIQLSPNTQYTLRLRARAGTDRSTWQMVYRPTGPQGANGPALQQNFSLPVGDPETREWTFTTGATAPAADAFLGMVNANGNTNEWFELWDVKIALGDHIPADPGEPTLLAFDEFDRTLASGWGLASSGQTWLSIGTPNNQHGVADGSGWLEHLSVARNLGMLLDMEPAVDLDITTSWSIDRLPVGGNQVQRFLPRYISAGVDYHTRITITPAGAVTSGIFRADESGLGPNATVPGAGPYVPGTILHTRVQSIGSSPTRVRSKTWVDGQPEPEEWLNDGTDSAAGFQVAGRPLVRGGLAGSVTSLPSRTNVYAVRVTNGVDGPTPDRSLRYTTSLNPSQTELSVGMSVIGAVSVIVILTDAATDTEIARTTAMVDPTTGWANVRFTNRDPDTEYLVHFDLGDGREPDMSLSVATLPDSGSFVALAGSCQFTGSNHPVFDRMREEGASFLAHMGDLHYRDATTPPVWRQGQDDSLGTARMRALLREVPMQWTPDNHDRIITNKGGTGGGLNLGTTDPRTNTDWRKIAGSDYPTADTLGRAWQAGRVLFIQTDMWTMRDDPDLPDPEPRTFLGAAQKAWWKATLEATDAALIVWLCSWTARNNANGRWQSFPSESAELEAWLNDRPAIKSRMVLIGGDSHSLQADDGGRQGSTFRFNGIPSLNMSGFNRSSDSGDGGAAPWNIANAPLRSPGDPEADWGGYSRLTIEDDGSELVMTWDAVRVNMSGETDIMATFTRTYGDAPVGLRFVEWDGTTARDLSPVLWDGTTATPLGVALNE